MADDSYDPDRLMTERPTGTPTMTVKPQKLSREDMTALVRKYNPDITDAAVRGEVDNMARESGGKSAVPGDFDKSGKATSGGLYQHHNERLTGLKAFAKKEGADWTDPDIQVRYSRLEKERDYPSLLKAQQSITDPVAAEDQFKRIFERPASVLWNHDANGRPVLGNDRYRYSDYAMGEHDGRRNTDIHYMTPAEYLDLSPELDAKPFSTPSGRSLMKSFNNGDQIEAIPTLDVTLKGPTATVTDQDGRHRALLAEQEGVEAIPVAIRKTGSGDPKEIVGMSGKLTAMDFPKAAPVGASPASQTSPAAAPKEPVSLEPEQEPRREPVSLFSRAEAAEPERDATGNPVDVAPKLPEWMQGAQPVQEATPTPSPEPVVSPATAATSLPSWMTGAQPVAEQSTGQGRKPVAEMTQEEAQAANLSPEQQRQWIQGQQSRFNQGVGAGMLNTVDQGARLLESGVKGAAEALGAPPMERVVPPIQQARLAGQEGMPPGSVASGEILSPVNFALPMGRVAGLGRGVNALANIGLDAGRGGFGGALVPPRGDETTGGNALRGAAAGAALSGILGSLGHLAGGPAAGSDARKLMDEGVRLTPGMMAGEAANRTESKLTSAPVTGDLIRGKRYQAMEDFNRAAYNRALAPIGERFSGNKPGFDGIKEVQDKIGAAYDQTLRGVQLRLTPQYSTNLAAFGNKIATDLPDPKQFDQLVEFIDRRVAPKFDATGVMPGPAFKQAESEITNASFKLHRSADWRDWDMADALDDLNKFLRQTLEDQNPGKKAELGAANKSFAMLARLRQAVSRRPAGNANGVFTPGDLLAAAKRGDRSAGYRSFSTGDALMQDLAGRAQRVMGNYPDSGTAGRSLLSAELLAGGVPAYFHHPEVLGGIMALNAAVAAPYLAPAIALLNKASPQVKNALSQITSRSAPLIGSAVNQ